MFSHVSTLSGAEISVGERFRANFFQVEPGVLPSPFGAIILVYSLVHPAVLEQWVDSSDDHTPKDVARHLLERK